MDATTVPGGSHKVPRLVSCIRLLDGRAHDLRARRRTWWTSNVSPKRPEGRSLKYAPGRTREVRQRSCPAAFFVPILVQRPLAAPQTRGPLPPVSATRTLTARREGVPRRAARFEVRLRRAVAEETGPSARGRRAPRAARASNRAEGVVLDTAGRVERELSWKLTIFHEHVKRHAMIYSRRRRLAPVGSAPSYTRGGVLRRMRCSSRDLARPSSRFSSWVRRTSQPPGGR